MAIIKRNNCTSDDEILELFSQEATWDVLEIIGFKGNPRSAKLADKDFVMMYDYFFKNLFVKKILF